MESLRPPLPDKDFFHIGETCRIAQVPAYTLRYWEKQFSPLRPVRLESGHRRYTRKDMDTILQIKDLLHQKKMTVAGALKTLINRQRSRPENEAASHQAASAAVIKILHEVRRDLHKLMEEMK